MSVLEILGLIFLALLGLTILPRTVLTVVGTVVLGWHVVIVIVAGIVGFLLDLVLD